jgi:hypothetical protein
MHRGRHSSTIEAAQRRMSAALAVRMMCRWLRGSAANRRCLSGAALHRHAIDVAPAHAAWR